MALEIAIGAQKAMLHQIVVNNIWCFKTIVLQ